MNILVTGSRGLVGTHLLKSLKDHNISEWDLQIGNNIKDISPANLENVDIVVHLAAWANVRESIKDPHKYLVNNIEYTKDLFDLCKQKHVPIIYASSSCVHNWSRTPYGISKRMNEVMAPPKSVGLRFTTIYGDNARESMLIAKIQNKTLEYMTNHVRDFIHVEDVVSAITHFINTKDSWQAPTYEIGTGVGVSVKDLVERCGIDVPLKQGDDFEAINNTANILEMVKLGWYPKHNIWDQPFIVDKPKPENVDFIYD